MSRAKAVKVVSPPAGNQHPLFAQDTLLNLVTGMGTDRDKLQGTVFNYQDIPKAQLDAAYRGDWISRKIIDIPAFDSFREWRTWEADKKDITKIEAVEKTFGVRRKAMMALQRGRLYGGGALIMGVDDGLTSDQPMDFARLGKDCLKFLHVVSRHEISASEMDWDVLSPYYGQPKYYTQSGQAGANQQGIKIHPSRVIRFVGAESTDLNANQGWGDSLLQVCADAVMAAGTVSQTVAQLVAEAKVDVVKVPELSEKIVNVGYEDRLKKRFALANVMKSVYGVLIVDAAEEWERLETDFSGLPDVLKMYLMIACGAADIPATRFLSQSPTGLSATGESDTRNYYDRVSTEQNVVVSPAMEPLDKVLLASALGKIPPEMFYSWEPLWQMTEAEKAEVAVKKSQVAKADADMGLITALVLQKARENQLIEDGTYPGLELLIEEFGDDVDERAAEVDPPVIDPETGEAVAPLPGKTAKVIPFKKPGALPTAAKGAKTGTSDYMADASTPRTLYVRRDVINKKEITKWFKDQGFDTVVTDLHCTIMYSKKAVDWLKAGQDYHGEDGTGNYTVPAGGPRVMEQFGVAQVMAFANSHLAYRHMSIKIDTEASYDYPDYTPHITISYKLLDRPLSEVLPWQGEIQFGPEIFEEIQTGFNNETDVIEDAALHGPGGKFKGRAGVSISKESTMPSGFVYAADVPAEHVTAIEESITRLQVRRKTPVPSATKWKVVEAARAIPNVTADAIMAELDKK